MMGDGSPIKSYFEQQLTEVVAEKIKSEVVKSVALGTGFEKLAKNLTATGGITKSRALSVARTEVNRVRREATRQVYAENSDIITKWEWVASKSPRTYIVCLALDGEQFDLENPFPQHINCRCSMIAVIEDLPRPKRTLGKDWFDRQSDEVKESILGKESLAAYRNGDAELKDFVGWRNDKRFGRSVYRKPLMSVLQSKPMESGAGGNWRRFDEKFDASIVKQTTGVSCVSAVGEMLLRKRGINISQETIRDIVGEPAYAASLARCLNEFDKSDDGKVWRGFASDEESLAVLLKQKLLGVVFVEPQSKIGHAVIVDGTTRSGFIKIKDPYDQTSYKMTLEDFKAYWGGEVILRWHPEK